MIQTLTESTFVRVVVAATVLLSLGAASPAAAADTVDTDGAADGAAALSGPGGDVVGEKICANDADAFIGVLTIPEYNVEDGGMMYCAYFV
jgi:hypothetical protein